MNLKFWQKKPKKTALAKEASDYKVKSYAKDGGFIRSPDRAGRNQNSSTYGGMGERELQLRMELLVDQVLSSQRSVFKPAQELVDFSLTDQERFLESIEHLSNTSVELAYNFCHFGPPSLKQLDESDWPAWIVHLLEIYEQQGVNGCIATMKTLDRYLATISVAPTAVSFEEIHRVIESIITGLNGRALKLEQSDALFTDTETIHLPENISTFQNHEDNFALYKTIAAHQWAQTWYGTWRVDVELLVGNFMDKQRAVNVFHKLETIRLDANIKRDLPGIGRVIEKFNSLLVADDLPRAWQDAVTTLSEKNATAHDSARLLYELYDHDFVPEDTLYQGVLDPALAKQKIEERIGQDKTSLQNKLVQLQQELEENRTESPVDSERDSDRMRLREAEDDEMPDGYRLTLEYDGETIDPPEDIQNLLDSIQQDLGEIPEDYLPTAEESMYQTGGGEEEKDEVNIRPEAGEVFLYDEWDHSRQKYRKEWCQLRERKVEGTPSDFVEQTLDKHRGLLKHLHRTFEALREDDRRIRKQPYGEDIDIDAVIDSYADLINGEEVSQNLFIKQKKVDRNIAVMFMVDMSGSTSGWINEMEREALVLLCESLEILGDRYAIYGFSGLTHRRCDLYKIKEFEEPYTTRVKNRIAGIEPQDYTRMGAAIRHLSKLLARVEAKTKVLITLSDGRPDDQDGYRGSYGIEDTRRALIEAKFLGIHPFCITIDEEAMDYLQHMYGPVNFTIVDQVDKLPYKVSEIYRRITV